MTIEQTAIWDYLVTNALGSNNAKQMKVIASAIGVPSTGTNSDNIRSFINDMVINHNKPIGTSLSGAFIILNDIERENAAKFLEKNSRASNVRNNGNYIPE